MNRDRAAKLITALILALLVSLIWIRRSGGAAAVRQSSSDPVETVYAMLDAARAGNIKGYLSQYSAPMEGNLRHAISDQGEDGFKDYLVKSNAAIKGIAVMGPKPVSEQEVEVRVEYVFQDRNEAQTVYLENRSGAWRIFRVDGSERVKTLVPYGTPVE